jgi:hypothetical protein
MRALPRLHLQGRGRGFESLSAHYQIRAQDADIVRTSSEPRNDPDPRIQCQLHSRSREGSVAKRGGGPDAPLCVDVGAGVTAMPTPRSP